MVAPGSRRRIWTVAALGSAGVAYASATLWGVGPLRRDALLLAALVSLFTYGLNFVRWRRATASERRAAALSRLGRGIAAVICGGLTAVAGFALATQVRTGYIPLAPDALDADAPPATGFYAVQGRAQHWALYEMHGSEGDRFVVPLEGYRGRLLLVTEARPPDGDIRATGRLRDDVRAVQTTSEGRDEGAFLPLYRAHVGLAENARVYFLDTSVRAGANVRSIALVAAPLYLLLLLIGTPVHDGGRRPGVG